MHANQKKKKVVGWGKRKEVKNVTPSERLRKGSKMVFRPHEIDNTTHFWIISYHITLLSLTPCMFSPLRTNYMTTRRSVCFFAVATEYWDQTKGEFITFCALLLRLEHGLQPAHILSCETVWQPFGATMTPPNASVWRKTSQWSNQATILRHLAVPSPAACSISRGMDPWAPCLYSNSASQKNVRYQDKSWVCYCTYEKEKKADKRDGALWSSLHQTHHDKHAMAGVMRNPRPCIRLAHTGVMGNGLSHRCPWRGGTERTVWPVPGRPV